MNQQGVALVPDNVWIIHIRSFACLIFIPPLPGRKHFGRHGHLAGNPKAGRNPKSEAISRSFGKGQGEMRYEKTRVEYHLPVISLAFWLAKLLRVTDPRSVRMVSQ
jgi:hypothetical protein